VRRAWSTPVSWIGSAGLIRAALSQALHYADHRSAFGTLLSELPLQAPVLADLALEWAGATHLAFRLARTIDGRDDVSERLLGRLLTPVAKYWNCKRATAAARRRATRARSALRSLPGWRPMLATPRPHDHLAY